MLVFVLVFVSMIVISDPVSGMVGVNVSGGDRGRASVRGSGSVSLRVLVLALALDVIALVLVLVFE